MFVRMENLVFRRQTIIIFFQWNAIYECQLEINYRVSINLLKQKYMTVQQVLVYIVKFCQNKITLTMRKHVITTKLLKLKLYPKLHKKKLSILREVFKSAIKYRLSHSKKIYVLLCGLSLLSNYRDTYFRQSTLYIFFFIIIITTFLRIITKLREDWAIKNLTR